MGVLKLLGQQGDTRLAWDPANDVETKRARDKFLEYMKKGWKAWRMDESGKKGEPTTEFDPKAGAILVVAPMAGG